MSVTEVKSPVDPRVPVMEPLETPVPYEADILERAADLLEEEGWVTGTFFQPHAGRCAVGAIGGATRRVTIPRGQKARARVRAEKALAETLGMASSYGTSSEQIIRWNDSTKGLRKETVVRKFRETAARLAGR